MGHLEGVMTVFPIFCGNSHHWRRFHCTRWQRGEACWTCFRFKSLNFNESMGGKPRNCQRFDAWLLFVRFMLVTCCWSRDLNHVSTCPWKLFDGETEEGELGKEHYSFLGDSTSFFSILTLSFKFRDCVLLSFWFVPKTELTHLSPGLNPLLEFWHLLSHWCPVCVPFFCSCEKAKKESCDRKGTMELSDMFDLQRVRCQECWWHRERSSPSGGSGGLTTFFGTPKQLFLLKIPPSLSKN